MTSGIRLEELHVDLLRDRINDEFLVMGEASAGSALRLVEVSERASAPHQEAFALLFHGPTQYFLPQGIYKLKHAGLGEMDLFLVPVAQDFQGFQYEAVFNRLV
jgi:hypothetical protein